MKLFRRKKDTDVEKKIEIINLSNRLKELDEILISAMLKSKEFGIVINKNGDRMAVHKAFEGQGFGAVMGTTIEVEVDPFTFNREKHRITHEHKFRVDDDTYRAIKYLNLTFRKIEKEEKECQK